MLTKYRTIHSFGSDEFIISKSKFIGYAKPISCEDEAIAFIHEIKSNHNDATHNVYAYVYGETNNIQRYSDDGEPSGTAGIPVLEVIKKEDFRNVVVVVTRYFGGTKLGAGGLVRAYTKGAKIGLTAGLVVDKVLFKQIKVRIDYTLYGKVENELLRLEYVISHVIYDDAVNFIILCETENVNVLIDLIIELTSSRMTYEELSEEYYSVKDNKIIK